MTILVTGARGGFGKAFVPKLMGSVREDVLSVVRGNAIHSNEVECNLTDPNQIQALIRETKPSLIYHLAGSFGGVFESDILVNAYSSKWIFDEIVNSKLTCRVLVCGSAAEYGLVGDGSKPILETHPLNPVSVYGLTKVIQTNISSYYALAQGVDVVVARVFNLAVPGLSERLFYGRLTSLIDAYKLGEIDKMAFGNLESVRDYVDLDLAVAQITAIANRGIKGEIYNVGSGVPVRIKDLLHKLLVENNIPLECIEDSQTSLSKSVDVPQIYAQIQKVSQLLS